MAKDQKKRERTGRLTTKIIGLQQRLEDYSKKSSRFSAWQSRLKRFSSLRAGIIAAASAYYLLFSLFPLIMFIVNLLDLLDPELATRFEAAVPQLSVVIPQEILHLLQNFLNSVGRVSSVPVLSIAAFGLLWAASKGVGSIVAFLNKIYHTESKFSFVFRRFFGIAAIFTTSLILIAILFILAFYRLVIDFLRDLISLPDFLLRDRFDILANVTSLLLLTFAFTIIFSLLKRQRSYFRHTVFSAFLTALGWLIISQALSFFISRQTNYYLMYGSITSIIFLMLWLYLAVYILIAGAFVHSELILKYPRPPKVKKKETASSPDLTEEP
ncbi:MAG: YihY/virulence factor BrkB family protein [Saccharofermentanales bacterium]|jgi:membrane protein